MKPKQIKKNKLELVFDEAKRKEFLTGFQKRKNERRKKAKDELERMLKAERVRIRQEVKDGMKHMKKSFEPLRELTDEDKAVPAAEDEYEDDDVKVKIVELTTNDLAARRHMLGENVGEESEEDEDDSQHRDDADDMKNTNCIPGMDFDVNERKRRKQKSESLRTSKSDIEHTATSNKQKQHHADDNELKSKKDLNRIMKTKTLRKLKQSKAFKQKERIDKKANQKKSRREKNNTLRSLPAHLRKKKKGGDKQSVYNKGRKINKKILARKNQKRT